MTQRKDLKRRIRSRQAKTGESYTAARAQVLKQRVPTVEVPDLSPVAERFGIHARAFALSSELADDTVSARLFERLRAVLEEDLAALRLKRVLLDGDAVPAEEQSPEAWRRRAAELRRRLELGLRGATPDGLHLSFELDGETIIVTVAGPGAFRSGGHKPLLFVSKAGAATQWQAIWSWAPFSAP